jgi:hypothetical protein
VFKYTEFYNKWFSILKNRRIKTKSRYRASLLYI